MNQGTLIAAGAAMLAYGGMALYIGWLRQRLRALAAQPAPTADEAPRVIVR